MSPHHTSPTDTFWPAPQARTPVTGTVTVPGSKSVTARALLLAALADRPSVLEGALASRDTELMADALRTLGATITPADTGQPSAALSISPMPAPTESGIEDRIIACGLAGTVMRFLPLIAALYPGRTRFEGDPEASARPMAPLLEIAECLGAKVICHDQPGRLPFTVVGVRPQPSGSYSFPQVIEVDASASSQFLSAALLVAPLLGRLDGQSHTIRPRGELVSLPHVEMTAQALQTRGVHIDYTRPAPLDGAASPLNSDFGSASASTFMPPTPLVLFRETAFSSPSWTVAPGIPEGGCFAIEPDLSNAGVFVVAAMLTGGSVRIRNWPTQTTQAGDAWRPLLASLGATIVRDHADVSVTGPRDSNGDPSYPGFTWDLSALGELTPTIAALAMFASSPCDLRGVAHIRGHETDRLAALSTEIRRLGGEVIEHADGLTITPQACLPHSLHGADCESYADHRMATFAALVGLRVPGVRVANIGTTAKTMPGFAKMWHDLVCPELLGTTALGATSPALVALPSVDAPEPTTASPAATSSHPRPPSQEAQ